MFKKIVIMSLCFLGSISNIFAGTFYINPMLTYESVTKNDSDFDGFAPSLALGYSGLVRNAFYLMGEIFAWPTTIKRRNNATDSISLSTTYSYGIGLLPALVLDEDLLLGYLRIGAIATHFNDLDVTRSGFQAGAGFEVSMTTAWSFRGEYSHVYYRSISGVGSPSADHFSAGVIYRFY